MKPQPPIPTKCFLDVDELLAAWVQGALRLHELPDPYIEASSWGNYNIVDLVGWSDRAAEFFEPMTEEFWAELEPTPFAEDVVGAVIDAFGPDHVCLLTKPVLTAGCETGKRRWIERHFPRFRRQYLIGPPKAMCAGPDALLVDDSDRNVDEFIARGGQAVVFPRLWNRNYALAVDPVGYLRDKLAVLTKPRSGGS